MNAYELTVVLPGKITPAKKKQVLEKIESLIKTLKGKVKKIEEWGEIELAYTIKKNTTGFFLHFILELESKSGKILNSKFRLEEDIIRYLLIKGGDL
ncbi:30S ribosomal protein S6 [Candidatus Woesebacteria bacterium RIFCSPHIGHO2_01_FULL_38_10]|uniref:Small ribosomal subunit protein bS6 n=1 Tax=Candidatus Woesebacteria bacterium RIFCSPLOWO2_01_FULL_39_10b TaxID=1802517 RepID=A0A1F8B8R1_9BACT|nr:MAG: 30S ribosomal protein S6 [Candidatus Woesebacteria bacterium RIFCSPHIGHO2_01_FULL_38_10]OGM60411.1 MAG: 30S ribosomal protein S6 [Candidatus Woesebacteria bacterium RIFCSPLOWO2_01_FULL_39_10b]